jgi:hypothetical protein
MYTKNNKQLKTTNEMETTNENNKEELNYSVEYQTTQESHSYMIANTFSSKKEGMKKMQELWNDKPLRWVKAHVSNDAGEYLYSISKNGRKLITGNN